MAMKGASFREEVWRTLDTDAGLTGWRGAVHKAILALILLNVAAVVLESVPAISVGHKGWFRLFEIVSLAIFSLEYALRLWACTADERYAHPLKGRLRFALTPAALVDLAAFLPGLLSVGEADLRVVRLLRLLRVARVGKLGRYSAAASTLYKVVCQKREELMATLSLVVLVGIVCATLVYYAEHRAQPEAFPDIPHALWWAFVTITTVGYGDVTPITPLGKAIGVVTALLGILMIALPTGVLGAAFLEEVNRGKTPRTCPHCGKPL